ncbi:UDP-glucose 4-epimerase family protein [Ectopseudomonas alcaliphila]|nr:SDR family oxidoreductase [Pseudomonas alcaliphila]MDX5991173.1 SDR family oxidoreductase [Pseudomonas alcaliphila]
MGLESRVVLTGANGFVGRHLADTLMFRGFDFLALSRVSCTADYPILTIESLGNVDAMKAALSGYSVVIHTAARAHVMQDSVSDPIAEYRRVNTQITLDLAKAAVAAGVRRFIFISSIKVHGEATALGSPYRASDTLMPDDPYGMSKLEAEQGLMKLAGETGLEVVIIRPPLVYGPGVKGNFASLIKLMSKGLPLPLGAIDNKRSLVGIDNLVDLIIRCIDHPAAANQVFLAGDGEDLSTTELLRGVAEAIGRPAHLIPVPAALLSLGATLLGKRAVAQRLLGSLQVDISKARELLGWEPPVSVKEGLRRCVRDSSV